MATKRRFGANVPLVEKRQKREHPHVEVFTSISAITKDMAKIKKQEIQFKALLQQVFEMTDQVQINFVYSKENAVTVLDNSMKWLQTLQDAKESHSKTRDSSLKTLRDVDVLDDDALKGAALILTETETKLAAIEAIESRWKRIVRHTSTTKTIQDHTKNWFERFWRQWDKTDALIKERTARFKENLKKLDLE